MVLSPLLKHGGQSLCPFIFIKAKIDVELCFVLALESYGAIVVITNTCRSGSAVFVLLFNSPSVSALSSPLGQLWITDSCWMQTGLSLPLFMRVPFACSGHFSQNFVGGYLNVFSSLTYHSPLNLPVFVI